MKAYKGFNEYMSYRDFQYEEGKEYSTDEAKCCKTGFHACEYPLDCFSYYSPNDSVYHEVELDGNIDNSDQNDSKVSATKIKIGLRLDIAGMVKAAIDFTMSKIRPEAKANENYGASSATGYKGASSATGYCCSAEANVPSAIAVAWGYKGKQKVLKVQELFWPTGKVTKTNTGYNQNGVSKVQKWLRLMVKNIKLIHGTL